MRLDLLLVHRGLVESRSQAQARIMAGEVMVNDHRVDKAGTAVALDATLRLKGNKSPFVSRGGVKLAHALQCFDVHPEGERWADLGASTGGFTDCLLQAGAAEVIAVDVGYGQLHLRLRRDPRVVVFERTNARYVDRVSLGLVQEEASAEAPAEACAGVVIDCSFISLKLLLPAAHRLLKPGGLCLPLVKPQFEVGRGRVGRGGVVREEETRAATVDAVIQSAESLGFVCLGQTRSPITGPKGNVEFLLHLQAT